ncbi:MAG: FG-GAP repeat protein [Planctomycetes bacterium]|nr:FG-GAP repeat protein [Planctomycetota bacterium]
MSARRPASLPVLSAGLLSLLLGVDTPAQIVHTSVYPTGQGAMGHCVGAAFDVNHDNVGDVFVGEPSVGSGSLFVRSGGDWSLLRVFHGDHADDQFGFAAAGLGDVNGDGFADVAVGAPWSDGNGQRSGMVRVLSGKTGATLWTLHGSSGEQFGYSVARAGDIDHDGKVDVVAGAPFYDGVLGTLPDAGRVRVLSGANGAILFSFVGKPDNLLGLRVAGGGDVDGDGWDDLLMNAPGDASGGFEAGRIDVRSGHDGSLVFTRYGSVVSYFGCSLDMAGDADGDGLVDVLVGAMGETTFAGAMHVFRGPVGAAWWTFHGDAQEDRFGSCVATAGDADEDGTPDFLGGTNPQGGNKPPYVRCLSGKSGLPLCDDLTGPPQSQFGYSIAALGDVSGDGWIDVAVGAPNHFLTAGYSGTATVMSPVTVQPSAGFAGPGPVSLAMYGTPLRTGGKADLRMSGAPAHAATLLALAFGELHLPFKGGVLVPDLTPGVGAGFVFATDAQGALLIPDVPGGLGLFDLWLQCLVQDAAQPLGFDLSNAVHASFLP